MARVLSIGITMSRDVGTTIGTAIEIGMIIVDGMATVSLMSSGAG